MTLQEAQKHSYKVHFRNRCQAIELQNRGKSVAYISNLFKVRQEAVYSWINLRGGIDLIFASLKCKTYLCEKQR